jgi:glycosyltransferase involved in cell wall biosynthesis
MTTLTTIFVNYNHARFIPHSLGSLLAQTCAADELIVIDDASTDHSVEAISSLLPHHPNARLIRNPVNQGCFANMNDGLKLAQGDVVHLAAADDVFYPEFYAKAMHLMDAHPEAAIFSSRSDIIDEQSRNANQPVPWAGHPQREQGFISPVLAARILMREDGWFMGNTALFRRKILMSEGCFPEDLLSFSDGYVCRLLALKYGACFSPDILAAWRRMTNGFASSVNENPEKAHLLAANAERRMLAAATVFPAGYAKRWKARQLFDVRRAALAKVASRSDSAGAPHRILARLAEKVRAAILLIRLRPWDAMTNIRQRIDLYRGRI